MTDSDNKYTETNITSALIMEEPLHVNSIITFGIGGGCILKELMVNASIDGIYGNYTLCVLTSNIEPVYVFCCNVAT